jgi:hypothetical protein
MKRYFLIIMSLMFSACFANQVANNIHSFRFKAAGNWQIKETNPFMAISPDGSSMIREMILDSKYDSEDLDFVNYLVTMTHQKQFGGQHGNAAEVSGINWIGYLQSHVSGMGGYEFQLVARADDKTYVFYLALPMHPSQKENAEFEKILLSLEFEQTENVPRHTD